MKILLIFIIANLIAMLSFSESNEEIRQSLRSVQELFLNESSANLMNPSTKELLIPNKMDQLGGIVLRDDVYGEYKTEECISDFGTSGNFYLVTVRYEKDEFEVDTLEAIYSIFTDKDCKTPSLGEDNTPIVLAYKYYVALADSENKDPSIYQIRYYEYPLRENYDVDHYYVDIIKFDYDDDEVKSINFGDVHDPEVEPTELMNYKLYK